MSERRFFEYKQTNETIIFKINNNSEIQKCVKIEYINENGINKCVYHINKILSDPRLKIWIVY